MEEYSEQERDRFTAKKSSILPSNAVSYRGGGSGFFGGLVTLLALAAVAGGIGVGVMWHTTTETKTCEVIDKSATRGSKDGTDYRIYTKDCGVLGIGDDWLIGKFDSSDRYGAFLVNRTYEIKTIGWRFPLTSTFPNIVEFREVGK